MVKDEQILVQFIPMINHLMSKFNIPYSYRDDLRQEILMRIWGKMELYDEQKASLSTYLYTLISNYLKNYKTRYKQYEYYDEELVNLFTTRDYKYEKYVMSKLKPYTRDYLYNCSISEVSKKYNIHWDTMKKMILKDLKKIGEE